jgi:regulator of nucleoside diphosphate kinase
MKEIIINSLDATRIRQRISRIKNGNAYSVNDIQRLVGELNRAKQADPGQIPADVITMHSIVKIKYISNDKTFTMQLVYPEEANIQENKISIFAPIAMALLGYKKGDIVNWPTPGGKIKIKIEDILYQPEAAGDFHL